MSSGQPTSLGSRKRAFIPMAPRNLKSRTEQYNPRPKATTDQDNSGDRSVDPPPYKKFKSNVAPKGTKLAAGYVDRAKERLTEKDGNVAGEDKQKRLEALEEMLKLQQIDQAVFESLRDEIGIGGDLDSTHLVKGLDFKLLERTRRGEDVSTKVATTEEKEDMPVEDIEAELAKALEKETTLHTESDRRRSTSKVVNEDHASSTAPVGSLSRDELLKRLKENRKNPGLANVNPTSVTSAVEPQHSSLDHSRFRKLESVSKPNKRRFTETINGRRREVLVLTDKEGKIKRKTRWLDPEPDSSIITKQDASDSGAWGSDLPAEVLAQQKAAAAKAAQQAEDDDGDDDIFGGVQDYNPLADIESDEEKDNDQQRTRPNHENDDDNNTAAKSTVDTAQTAPLKSTARLRNYFGTNTSADELGNKDVAHDPAILAALKRAAQIRREEEGEEESSTTRDGADAGTTKRISNENESRNRALLKKLQQQSHQDDLDMDMGFGGNAKYDDDEDEGEDGGRRQKLSEWNGVDGYGEDDDDDDNGGGVKGGKKGGEKRKRGGKKRKGDKNSVADVMSVLEKRKMD